MKNFFVSMTIAMMFLGSVAYCDADVATATNESSFYLKGTHDEVCKFIETHVSDIIEAGGAKVVEKKNDTYKIRHTSRKETNMFTVDAKNDKGLYKTVFVKSHEGSLTDYSTEISVEVDKRGTKVTYSSKATVSDSNIRKKELQIHLKRSASDIKDYLEGQFP